MPGRLVIRLTRSPRGVLLEEAPPRELVEPRGARANSWEDVADLSARAGVVLDGWQELILETAMGERSDTTWAAKRVGISVPRQNGKSQLLVARALAGVLLFGEKKIVISAHQQDTAREAFSKMIEILDDEANGWLMDRVRPNGIMNAINREAVRFKNGASIQFKARSGAGGRGFSSDCLLLDEAQRLKRPAWVSINSTMSAMPNPQVWLLGTPPTREDIEGQMGEVFESIRTAAINGTATATAWCEWGVDPTDEAFLADLRASSREWSADVERICWAANPAWSTRINRDVVQGEHETYTPEEFAQDRLGVWLSDLGANGKRRWSNDLWATAETATSPPDGVRSFAVAFSMDGSRLSLAGAVKHPDGVHCELIDAFQGVLERGVDPLADWLANRWRHTAVIAILGAAGASLKLALREREVPEHVIHVMSTAEYFAANTMTEDAIKAERVTHPVGADGDVLDASVAVCDGKKRGMSGQWGWEPTVPGGDETPVEAFCAANWAALTTKRKPRGDERRKAVIL